MTMTTNDAAAKLNELIEENAKPKPLPDGIYFGLPAERYHQDAALGSTDLRRLAKNPFNYWYTSHMNPNRPPDRDTPSRVLGRAMHKLVYEGEAAFDSLYMRGPTQDPESTPAEKAALTKENNKRARSLGLTGIPADHYDRIAIASAMITQDPELATVFSGGMSEVSFFWTRDGVRLKARFDYLKPRGVGDLKSVANQYENDFETECRSAIARYRYDAQAAHYLDARTLVAAAINEGRVYGDHDPAWLKTVASTQRYAWQWIFHQTENAPITFSLVLSPQNPMVELGRAVINRGIERWREYMEKCGPDRMWLLSKKPQEIAVEEMPNWYGRTAD